LFDAFLRRTDGGLETRFGFDAGRIFAGAGFGANALHFMYKTNTGF
jgi:hypothetical protein